MSDLTEFLLARIAEDQSAAENRAPDASIHEVGCYYYNFTLSPRVWIEACCDCSDETRARSLAEYESKRQIVGYLIAARASRGLRADTEGRYLAVWWVATQLAKVYAAHPDYDEAWRP